MSAFSIRSPEDNTYYFLNMNSCRPVEIAIKELPINVKTVTNDGARKSKISEPTAAGAVKTKQKIKTFLETFILSFYYDFSNPAKYLLF